MDKNITDASVERLDEIVEEIGFISQCLEIDPESSELLNKRGLKRVELHKGALQHLKETDKSALIDHHLEDAMDDYEAALGSAVSCEELVEIHFNYGDAHFLLGNSGSAEGHYKIALQIDS